MQYGSCSAPSTSQGHLRNKILNPVQDVGGDTVQLRSLLFRFVSFNQVRTRSVWLGQDSHNVCVGQKPGLYVLIHLVSPKFPKRFPQNSSRCAYSLVFQCAYSLVYQCAYSFVSKCAYNLVLKCAYSYIFDVIAPAFVVVCS